MANKSSSKYLTGTDANDHHRTTTGRDLLRLGNLPTTTLLTIEISETATVDIEYSEDGTAFIKVATITETSGVQFAIPASILSVHVTQYTSGFVRVLARTVVLDNIPSQTLLIYNAATVTSPIIQSADHGNLTGLGDDDHTQYVLRGILTTDGDLFYRNAGVIARLPIGTDGQVLTVVGGLPAWV